MKRRQRDKILKIVARQINSGDYSKLKPVHYRCIRKTISDYINRKYITEFQPWWYGQFDNWRNRRQTQIIAMRRGSHAGFAQGI